MSTNHIHLCPLSMLLIINIDFYYMLNRSLFVEGTIYISYIYWSFYFLQLKFLLSSKLQTYNQLYHSIIQQCFHCYSFLDIYSFQSNLYCYFSQHISIVQITAEYIVYYSTKYCKPIVITRAQQKTTKLSFSFKLLCLLFL